MSVIINNDPSILSEDDHSDFMVHYTTNLLAHLPILEVEFHRLVKEWRRETAVYSSITKKVLHPAYQQIIGMGPVAIPWILRELERKPGHWFWALNAISRKDPVAPEDNFDTAVTAWLDWGRKRGYLE